MAGMTAPSPIAATLVQVGSRLKRVRNQRLPACAIVLHRAEVDEAYGH